MSTMTRDLLRDVILISFIVMFVLLVWECFEKWDAHTKAVKIRFVYDEDSSFWHALSKLQEEVFQSN